MICAWPLTWLTKSPSCSRVKSSNGLRPQRCSPFRNIPTPRTFWPHGRRWMRPDAMLRRYLLRRFIHVVFLLVGISALSFVLLELAPGDFLGEAKLNPQLSAQTIAALREQYGLNKSLPQKYVYWLGSVAKGSFGVSFAYNLPVST